MTSAGYFFWAHGFRSRLDATLSGTVSGESVLLQGREHDECECECECETVKCPCDGCLVDREKFSAWVSAGDKRKCHRRGAQGNLVESPEIGVVT
jgi:hypothetical protein